MTEQSDTFTASAFRRSRSSFWFDIKRYRLQMGFIMLCADLLGFMIAGVVLFSLNLWLDIFLFQWGDVKYLTFVLLCLAWYFPTKLYPGIGLNPAEEIRLVVSNTCVAFMVGLFLFGLNMKWHPNHLAVIPFGLMSMVMVLAMRWVGRIHSVKHGLWGAPVVVIGKGMEANKLARYFLNRGRLGFIPRYVVTDLQSEAEVTSPVSIIHRSLLMNCRKDFFSDQHVHTALIDIAEAQDIFNSPLFARLSQLFTRLIFVSNPVGLDSASFQVHDFEGISGIEVSKNVLGPVDTFIKRTMDIVFSSVLLMVTSPIWMVTMLLIYFDSPGPIFYTQLRVGKNRKPWRDDCLAHQYARRVLIYKFRTMVLDADQKLKEHLTANPLARAEWDQTQKLQNDPRITRVGKWIRKFSIDELPQLINVLKGEMSLVGPRPIVFDEIHHYQDKIALYASVRPGVTGLWQVSGRNNTSYDERVAYDSYYVHNWSPWLDIYILLRTVWVVIRGHGAY